MSRADVVQAAFELVQAEGPDALGISRVARILGIRPPSLYNHVGSGEALRVAVVVEAFRQCVETLRASSAAESDPEDRLMALCLSMRTWVLENRGLYALMARVEPDNDHPAFGPVAREMITLFADPLERLGVPDHARIHSVRAIRAALHGFLLLESTGQFQLAVDREQSFRWLVEALIRGARTA